MGTHEEDNFLNQTTWAGEVLDHVLDEDRRKKEEAAASGRVDVREERRNRPVLDVDTGRTKSRVLFVTTEMEVLIEDSLLEKHYRALATQFDEVHVMVFTTRNLHHTEPRRRGDNIWIYPVHVDAYWHIAFVAAREARARVTFNGSIRPDIIVGVDPLIAGLAAYEIAKAFNRAWQLHVHKNVFGEQLDANGDPVYGWRERRLAKSVLKRAKSIRVKTDQLEKVVKQYCKKNTDLQVLPKFYNIKGYEGATISYDLHEKYPQYTFIILTFGPLTADSYLHDVFSATHQLLQNPRIGMVVVGNGPAKKLFVEKAEILGITQNVVFVPEAEDLYSVLKTADVMIEADTGEVSEERVMHAASAGLPMIMKETDLRTDLFSDGNSAFLCPVDDTNCMRQKLNKFLNTPSLRTRFAEEAKHIADTRLEEDPTQYYIAYRDSIETVLLNERAE